MKQRVRVQVLSSLRGQARHPGGGRGRDRGTARRQRHRLFAATRRRSRSGACRTGPASPPASSAPLAEANVNVDMIVQNIGADGRHRHDLHRAARPTCRARRTCWTRPQAELGFEALHRRPGRRQDQRRRRRHAQPCGRRHDACSRRWPTKGINIQVISTSEIKVSVLIGVGLHRTGGARAAHRLWPGRARPTLRCGRADPAASPPPDRSRLPTPCRIDRLMARGAGFFGSRYAIMGGAMSWVSERHLVAALSNAGAFGVIACGAMEPTRLARGDRRHPGADRQALRRQPHHHASPAGTACGGVPGGEGRPYRLRRRHPAGCRHPEAKDGGAKVVALRPGAGAGEEAGAQRRRCAGDRGLRGRRAYRPGLA